MKSKFTPPKGRLVVLLIALFGLSLATFAQGTLTGSISDDEGEPLIGASVLLVNSGSGTVTDYDGNYSINIPVGTQVVRFSYTFYAFWCG